MNESMRTKKWVATVLCLHRQLRIYNTYIYLVEMRWNVTKIECGFTLVLFFVIKYLFKLAWPKWKFFKNEIYIGFDGCKFQWIYMSVCECIAWIFFLFWSFQFDLDWIGEWMNRSNGIINLFETLFSFTKQVG